MPTSILREQLDNDALAFLVRLQAYMVDRWARDGKTAAEACEVHIGATDLMRIAGKGRTDVARKLASRCANVGEMSARHQGDITLISWPKFAEFQGLDYRIKAQSAHAPAHSKKHDKKEDGKDPDSVEKPRRTHRPRGMIHLAKELADEGRA